MRQEYDNTSSKRVCKCAKFQKESLCQCLLKPISTHVLLLEFTAWNVTIILILPLWMSTKWLLATNAACHVILWKMKWPKCLTSIIFRRTMNFQLGLCVSNVLLKTRSQQGHIQNRPTGRATSWKHTWVWTLLFGVNKLKVRWYQNVFFSGRGFF